MADSQGQNKSTFEFPVPVDKTAYFIPTIGIFALSFIGSSALFLIPVLLLSKIPGLDKLSGDFLANASMIACTVVAIGASLMWVTYFKRKHAERKIIIDKHGITYCRFSNDRRLMRWDEIISAVETETLDSDGDWYTLEFKLPGRRFKIVSGDFQNYEGIKLLTAARIPQKTKTAKPPSPGSISNYDAMKAMEEWERN